MGRCPRPLACISLAILLGFAGPAPAASPRSLVATLQRVADGDTITAVSANGTKLRLLGSDAPEITHDSKQGSSSLRGRRSSRSPDLWPDGEAGGRCRTDTVSLKEGQR